MRRAVDLRAVDGGQYFHMRPAPISFYYSASGPVGTFCTAPSPLKAYEDLAKEYAALEARLQIQDARVHWLLDQLCPSLFPDHGLYRLFQIAKAMRAVPSGQQEQAGLAAVDKDIDINSRI